MRAETATSSPWRQPTKKNSSLCSGKQLPKSDRSRSTRHDKRKQPCSGRCVWLQEGGGGEQAAAAATPTPGEACKSAKHRHNAGESM